ncbi:proteoglycan 4-like [Paramacrobiotus metropolitanus]|uniref:proteoglycan 4-like n=1 Tax=Paramacrobiotus metropolitanus TaxID=2943436 RepID=UPI0024460958|nr:proteoglycan 4-like [Paramacrobiotus metropolitanus]XP_055337846.1 proteoglycan 4-like [Paramacrobiotus metropolitanus]
MLSESPAATAADHLRFRSADRRPPALRPAGGGAGGAHSNTMPGIKAAADKYERFLDDMELEFGPGIVDRLKSKFVAGATGAAVPVGASYLQHVAGRSGGDPMRRDSRDTRMITSSVLTQKLLANDNLVIIERTTTAASHPRPPQTASQLAVQLVHNSECIEGLVSQYKAMFEKDDHAVPVGRRKRGAKEQETPSPPLVMAAPRGPPPPLPLRMQPPTPPPRPLRKALLESAKKPSGEGFPNPLPGVVEGSSVEKKEDVVDAVTNGGRPHATLPVLNAQDGPGKKPVGESVQIRPAPPVAPRPLQLKSPFVPSPPQLAPATEPAKSPQPKPVTTLNRPISPLRKLDKLDTLPPPLPLTTPPKLPAELPKPLSSPPKPVADPVVPLKPLPDPPTPPKVLPPGSPPKSSPAEPMAPLRAFPDLPTVQNNVSSGSPPKSSPAEPVVPLRAFVEPPAVQKTIVPGSPPKSSPAESVRVFPDASTTSKTISPGSSPKSSPPEPVAPVRPFPDAKAQSLSSAPKPSASVPLRPSWDPPAPVKPLLPASPPKTAVTEPLKPSNEAKRSLHDSPEAGRALDAPRTDARPPEKVAKVEKGRGEAEKENVTPPALNLRLGLKKTANYGMTTIIDTRSRPIEPVQSALKIDDPSLLTSLKDLGSPGRSLSSRGDTGSGDLSYELEMETVRMIVIGHNVPTGSKSSLRTSSTARSVKHLRITFNDQATTTHEYPSERSLDRLTIDSYSSSQCVISLDSADDAEDGRETDTDAVEDNGDEEEQRRMEAQVPTREGDLLRKAKALANYKVGAEKSFALGVERPSFADVPVAGPATTPRSPAPRPKPRSGASRPPTTAVSRTPPPTPTTSSSNPPTPKISVFVTVITRLCFNYRRDGEPCGRLSAFTRLLS